MTVVPLPSRRDPETGGHRLAADFPAQVVSIRGFAKVEVEAGA